MGTGVGSNDDQFYRADMRMVGKTSVEWDLNDWKWDGDHFTATPVNRSTDEHRSHQNNVLSNMSCSDELNLEVEKGKNEMEKRRKVIVIEDESLNNNLNDVTGNISLKIGGNGSEREFEILEGTSVKNAMYTGASTSRVICQVEDCEFDLSISRDYHRRHKVCERHSKAAEARVGNAMQRFCQQCSRFHVLQEFDEGKRSCRRRLAGHNKRRRKRQPETAPNGNPQNDEQSSGYLLISVLKILSNMNSNKSDHTKDQDLISHLLRSIATITGAHVGESISGIPTGSQGLLNKRTIGNSEVVSAVPSTHRLTVGSCSSQMPQNDAREVRDSTAEQAKLNNFDLNDVYIDSDDGMEDLERSQIPPNLGSVTGACPLLLHQDSHQSSPPQTGRNSDSASAQSHSSTSGEAQSRTGRIVFKLFGKAPNDLPNVLRSQILGWLAHSPTEIESYIRPGCVVLTIYLRLTDSEWDELCYGLGSSLSRLLAASDDTFWRTGWVYIRVQHQIAFMHNGHVVLNASLSHTSNNYTKILSITPIAICASEKAQFSIKGLNLSRPSTRVLCALKGQYLAQENIHELMDDVNIRKGHDEFQCINFSCSVPNVTGRGFFEVEDNGLSSSFFPFIIADKDICTEIRMLENAINLPETDEEIGTGKLETKTQAMNFICEMGWLLHRTQLKSRLGHSDPNTDRIPLKRFKWLIEFSMDHDWHAVVKKLLDIFLYGTVSSGEHASLKNALVELGLLHRAVRRNSRSLVHLLLRYTHEKAVNLETEWKSLENEEHKSFLFKPDAAGPAGLTPLHIAAGRDGSENILDALLDDPGMVGIKAWKNACDSTGFTPEDYARLRGHYPYIHLVQKKINRKPISGQVALDILGDEAISDKNTNQKHNKMLNSGFEIGKRFGTPKNCKLCDQRQLLSGNAARSLVYRPAVFSMVAIAAVCVCVALLFKSSPEVLFVLSPFRWEMLDYGSS